VATSVNLLPPAPLGLWPDVQPEPFEPCPIYFIDYCMPFWQYHRAASARSNGSHLYCIVTDPVGPWTAAQQPSHRTQSTYRYPPPRHQNSASSGYLYVLAHAIACTTVWEPSDQRIPLCRQLVSQSAPPHHRPGALAAFSGLTLSPVSSYPNNEDLVLTHLQ